MDALQISLIIIGLVIVALIYFFSKQNLDDSSNHSLSSFAYKLMHAMRSIAIVYAQKLQQKKNKSEEDYEDDIPTLDPIPLNELEALGAIVPLRRDSDDYHELVELEDIPKIQVDDSEQIAAARGEDMIVVLTIMARQGSKFDGADLMKALNAANFVYGQHKTYEYLEKGDDGRKVWLFQIVNVMEPGIFEQEHLDEFETPGIVMILQLPAPLEPRLAFEKMLEKANQLAANLDGILCDETRSTLTQQMISHLKEKIESYRFKLKMSSLQQHRK